MHRRTFDATGRTFSGGPHPGDEATVRATVTANDLGGPSVESGLDIAVNRAPPLQVPGAGDRARHAKARVRGKRYA